MKVHVEDKESMQEPHRTAPHMQFGMVMQLLSRLFVFFSSKILSIKRPSRLGCLQNSNTQICKKWFSKESKSQDFKGPLLGFLEKDSDFLGFFSLWKAPKPDLQFFCNLLRLFMPTRSWEYLSDWPQGCLVLPKFCAVFFVKDRGRMIPIIVDSLWLDDCTTSFRKDVWKGFTKKCTNFRDDELITCPLFWGPEKTSEKKTPTNWCHWWLSTFMTKIVSTDPEDGVPFLSWGFRTCV